MSSKHIGAKLRHLARTELVHAYSSLRLKLHASALQSEVRGGGEEMAIVGPDFMEPDLDSGYDVDGVPGAKRRRFGEASGKEFNLSKDVIRYRNQSPPFIGEVVQEKICQLRRGFWLERSFAYFTVKRARQFGNAERRCVYVVC